jgi:hypothetical protein
MEDGGEAQDGGECTGPAACVSNAQEGSRGTYMPRQ